MSQTFFGIVLGLLRRLLPSKGNLVVVAVLIATATPSPQADAQSVLPANVRDALARLEANIAVGGNAADNLSDYDRALLFKYNDDINAAALNGDISDTVYQAAQNDYAGINRNFAADAAADAGADFTVQRSTSNTYSPGTDSDYITVVDSPEDVTRMQDSYNNRVNDYLERNGILDEPRTDWHNKLDTDFMGDPRYVTQEQFEEIARRNNDAYKRRHAAEFERITRQPGGGKVDPQHIIAYTEEMDDFSRKKAKLLDEMLSNPSRFNDPRARADAFRTMAQQNKYISRIEMAEDYLRAQEGLPPRNRGAGGSLAKRGSKRTWGNSATIRDAYQAADDTLARAISNMTETMADAAKTNPQFRARASKDIAALMERLPEAERGKLLDRLRARHGAGFADDVADAARSRGTSLLSSVDDARGAGALDDAVRGAAGATDDLSRIARLKNGLKTAGAVALEGLGALGVAAELYTAKQQATTYLEAIDRALDPSLSDEEANAAFAKAQQAAEALAEAGTLGALMEAYPPLAAAMGTWVLTRHGGEWVLANTETGQAINRTATDVMDVGIQVAESARDRLTALLGGETQKMRDEAQQTDLCIAYTRALARGEIVPRPGLKQPAMKICEYIRSGRSHLIDDELLLPDTELVETDPCDAPRNALEAADAVRDAGDLGAAESAYGAIDASACPDVAETAQQRKTRIAETVDILVKTGEQASTSCNAAALDAAGTKIGDMSHPRLDPVNAALSTTRQNVEDGERYFNRAKAAFDAGDLNAAEIYLADADQAYARLGSEAGCAGRQQRIEVARSKVDRISAAVGKIDAAMAACDTRSLNAYAKQLAALQKPARALSQRAAAIPATISECEANDPEIRQARADADCRSQYGSGYSAGGFKDDGNYFCRPNKATADAWCNQNNKGSGWVSGKVKYNGTFDCQLTKAGRNASCRRQYGSGYFAGKVGKNGSYNCYMGKTARTSTCRRQYGAGWTAGKLQSNGQFNCYPPRNRTARRPTTPPPSNYGNRNRNGAANAAAAAAIAGAIITGIVATQQNRRRGNNCHRNPTTGQMHCGSN